MKGINNDMCNCVIYKLIENLTIELIIAFLFYNVNIFVILGYLVG